MWQNLKSQAANSEFATALVLMHDNKKHVHHLVQVSGSFANVLTGCKLMYGISKNRLSPQPRYR